MHHFQIMALKRLCEKHNLDIQLIDSTLTYEESKKYLLSLVVKDLEDLVEDGESQEEWYMKEHFLSYYISTRKQK